MRLKKVFALTVVASAFAFAQQETAVEPQTEPATDQAAVTTEPAEPAAESAPEIVLPSAQPEGVVAEQEQPPAQEPSPAPEPAPAPAPAPAPEPVAAPVAATEPAVADSAKPVELQTEKQTDVVVSEQPKLDSVQAAAQPAPQPARMGPPPKTPFTIVHGNAYNMVENEAAADNIDLLLKNRLVKFAGQKFVYVEPAGEMGVVALGNFFGGMDLSGDLGRATLGYANYGFAAELRLSLGQINISDGSGKKRGTYAGDDWGLTLSKVLGGFVVTAAADWITYADEMDVDPKMGQSVEERYRDLEGSLMVSDGPVASKHFWSAGVAFVRHENEKEVGDRVVNADVDSRTTIVPVFNYGTPALRSERANLYLGLNASWPITIFDATETYNAEQNRKVTTSQYVLSMNLVPNIVGEVLMNKFLMFFGEANYEWNVINYVWGKKPTGENYTIQESVENKVNASIGTRLQYDNLVACEFSLGDSFFTDTKSIFNGEGVFIKFGAFIYF